MITGATFGADDLPDGMDFNVIRQTVMVKQLASKRIIGFNEIRVVIKVFVGEVFSIRVCELVHAQFKRVITERLSSTT